MGPGRSVYIVLYGSYTTLGRPKGLKQIVLSSFVVFDSVNKLSNKIAKNDEKAPELRMQK